MQRWFREPVCFLFFFCVLIFFYLLVFDELMNTLNVDIGACFQLFAGSRCTPLGFKLFFQFFSLWNLFINLSTWFAVVLFKGIVKFLPSNKEYDYTVFFLLHSLLSSFVHSIFFFSSHFDNAIVSSRKLTDVSLLFVAFVAAWNSPFYFYTWKMMFAKN